MTERKKKSLSTAESAPPILPSTDKDIVLDPGATGEGVAVPPSHKPLGERISEAFESLARTLLDSAFGPVQKKREFACQLLIGNKFHHVASEGEPAPNLILNGVIPQKTRVGRLIYVREARSRFVDCKGMAIPPAISQPIAAIQREVRRIAKSAPRSVGTPSAIERLLGPRPQIARAANYIDVFVHAPPKLLKAAKLSPWESIHKSGNIAAVPIAHMSDLAQVIASSKVSCVVDHWTSIEQNWQHRWVEAYRKTLDEIDILVDKLLPRPPSSDLERLADLLKDAAQVPPGYLPNIVDAVNTLLRGINHRIKLPDGTLCLLACNRDRKGNPYVIFQTSTGDNRGGFGTTEVVIEPVPPRTP